MPWFDIPRFGNLILCAILVAATYAAVTAILAARGRPHLLPAARSGVYLTCALTAVAVFVLAYAFQTHDFRIRYVMRYSDRSMPWWYLWTALWGGQDGSLLWWTFLLCGYTAACTRSLRDRLLRLQPYILATLMSIVIFFAVLMLFSANPFATVIAGAPPDGEGLNPLLQNYWMTIHPPTLYLGMVGWSIPFAFAIAALVSGRLGDEWVLGVRRWALFAWIALATGNVLGMIWSYEELGWGGYWAWDPVENAAFMPLLPGAAFLHSVMLQERRGMFKVWNLFLVCLTFFMTIFGTFLTRSGMIASVHSFARSSIGAYFVVYMVLLVVVCAALIVWRLPQLRSENRIDSLLSRDFAFLLNNWILLGMMLFVLLATTFPLISEWLRGETVTVGPGYYNKWMVPLGLILIALVGVGPLLAWRKSTGSHLWRVLVVPSVAALVVLVAHVAFGPALGYPPYVAGDEIYDTATGRVLAAIYGLSPVFSSTLCTFVLVGHLQEFWRGARARMRGGREHFGMALFRLMARAKRRHGGYIVHLGLVAMYFGFTGAAYDTETEAALRPGEVAHLGDYAFRYDRPRMETDFGKRMIFTDMTVLKDGEVIGHVAPAKFVYNKPPGTATTEVAIRSTAKEDLYVIMNTVNSETQLGTFRFVLRPFVAWIWVGGLLMILGVGVSMAPSMRELLADVREPGSRMRGAATAAAGVLLAVAAAAGVSAAWPPTAHGQGDSSSLMAGSVTMRNQTEKQLFERLLCECGDCQRLPLSTCSCGWADDMRAEIRAKLESGTTPKQMQQEYRERFGAQALAIPSDEGLDRALWAVPVVAIAFAVPLVFWLGRRWVRANRAAGQTSAEPRADPEYDALLQRELDRLE